jgi:hypothetical protein
MQSDFWKVLVGLAIFVGFFTTPFWYMQVWGNPDDEPEPEIDRAVAGTECVLPLEEIRVRHMELIDDWRNEVVREGNRMREDLERAPRFPEKSLTNTCLGCHTDRVAFCDSCHNYVGEKPYCWDCHVDSSLTQGSEQ